MSNSEREKKCANHPGRKAGDACASCGDWVCSECWTAVGQDFRAGLCTRCLDNFESLAYAGFEAQTRDIPFWRVLIFAAGSVPPLTLAWVALTSLMVGHATGFFPFYPFLTVPAAIAIGFASLFGAKKRRGRTLQWISLSCTTVLILSGHIFITNNLAMTALSQTPDLLLQGWFLPLCNLWPHLINPPLGLYMLPPFAIALYTSWTVPKPARLRSRKDSKLPTSG